jgi:hypothetical protein
MTDTLPTPDERAAFEAWWKTTLRFDDRFKDATFRGWKARAALPAAQPEQAIQALNDSLLLDPDMPVRGVHLEAAQPTKYDDVLLPFLSLMRKELHANAGKGDRPGWLAMHPKELLLDVYYHLGKLQKAMKNNDGPGIQEYSADVANMAMMVLDACGGLAWVDYAAPVAAQPDTSGVKGLDDADR